MLPPTPRVTLIALVVTCWMAAAATTTTAAAAAAPPAICELRIVGEPLDNSIRSASGKCLRGSLSAGMHPMLRGTLHGIIHNASCATADDLGSCLLTFCGETQVILTNTVIVGMPVTAVCVMDTAKVTITGNSSIGNNTSTNWGSGGLAATENATATISGNTQITGNRAVNGSGGGVACVDNSTVLVTGNSIIANNTSTIGPGGGVYVGGNATATISGNSQITRNRAVNASGGGMACLDKATVIVTGNSSISNNTNMIMPGGGVYVANNATVTVSGDSQVISNCAVNGNGGAIACFDNSAVTITGTSIVRNNTCFNCSGGGVFAMDNATVTINGHSQITGNRAVNGTGGGTACFGNSSVTITGYTIVGNNTCNVMSYLSSVARSGCDMVVMDLCKLDTTHSSMIRKCDQVVTLMRSTCEIGEIARGDMCICCPPQQYSFTMNASSCWACPAHAVCPGGALIQPLVGYWHSSERSPQIIQCPTPEACGAGGVCQRGYTGNLCGSCQPGFGTTTPMKCNSCMKPNVQFGVYAVLCFVTVLFITITVHFTRQDNMQGSSTVRPTDLIKVLVQHLQYLVIVGSVSAPWPRFVLTLFRGSSVVFAAAAGQASSLDCWLSYYFPSGSLPLAIQRQLVYFIAPVVVFACVFVVNTCCVAVQRWFARVMGCWHQIIKSLLLVSALVMAYYAYPTLVKASLAFFACLPIDDANKQPNAQYAVLNHTAGYWTYDIDQACFTGWHLKWALSLGLLGVLVFCLGFPLALWWGLLASHTRADKPEFRAHFGFLYRNFRESKLWWEAVWLGQTVLLSTVSVFHFTLQAYYSTLLLLMVFMCSAAFQVACKPYALRTLHRIHLTSTSFLAVTTLGALWLFTVDKDITISIQNTHTAIGILLCIINVGFVGWCLYTVFEVGSSSVKVLWTMVSNMVHKLKVAVCGRPKAVSPSPRPMSWKSATAMSHV